MSVKKQENFRKESDVEIDNIRPPAGESWKFIDELKEAEKRYFQWTRDLPADGETSLSAGVTITRGVDCPTLDTAYKDLESFFAQAGIGLGAFRVATEIGEVGPYDSFLLKVENGACRIIADNVEGIRRGIFYLEDQLLGAEGPFLRIGETRRKAWLKNRVSRCFFGPIKRPPKNRDELMDDMDYYPEEYLNRLAHEGVNGLWLTVELKDLCRTEFAPEYGKDAPRRLGKLRRTVDKCLRYGIKTYLFMIEPACLKSDSGLLQRYPELGGAMTAIGTRCFCPSSETAYRYLRDSVNYIFLDVPRLGGIINISLGECATTCVSSLRDGATRIDCPHCEKLSPKDVLYNSVKAMSDGMRAANPDADFISWLYVPQAGKVEDWVFKLSSRLPEGVTLLYNFESGGEQTQQGKKRVGGDYWLSYVGPSERFRKIASNLDPNGHIGAKLQVANSHECATIPYIPVPGQLHKKYKAMRELGVTTVMQCWYFGNYPGLMNKAAGMLAFEDFTSDEDDFLMRLATPEWGIHAKEITSVWGAASAAYQEYPFSNEMQYYGPYHDGIAWPLYPTTQYLELAPTYQVYHPTSGDFIGDCLKGFTIDEIIAQSRQMSDKWGEAYRRMNSLREAFVGNESRLADIALMEATGLLFRSGHNIFRFHKFREEGDKDEMRRVMEEEAIASDRMAELCEADSRLGFHSEAEDYKFFPEKLRFRSELLRRFVDNPPEPASQGIDYFSGSGYVKAQTYAWKADRIGDELKISIELFGGNPVDQIFVGLAGSCVEPSMILDLNRNGTYYPTQPGTRYALTEKTESGSWLAEFHVPLEILPHKGDCFRLSFVRFRVNPPDKPVFDDFPKISGPIIYRLCFGFYHLRDMLNVSLREGMPFGRLFAESPFGGDIRDAAFLNDLDSVGEIKVSAAAVIDKN